MPEFNEVIKECAFIRIIFFGMTSSGATQVWKIESNDGSNFLGLIKWFGRWRKYSFYPHSDTIFEATCLREIADFCGEESRKHYQGRISKRRLIEEHEADS